MSAVRHAPKAHRPPTAAGPTRRRQRPRTTAVVVLLVAMMLPFVPLVLASLADGWFYPQLLPERLSTRAWGLVLAPGGRTWRALGDTVGLAAAVTLVAFVVAVPAGRVLGTRRFRAKRLVEAVLLAPVLVPGIAVAIGLHLVFLRLGLAGSAAGVVLVHLVVAIPYVVLLSAAVFANADLELESQARSLGASWWRAQWHVTLPLVAPGLAIAAMFGFLVSWGQYTLTLVIGGGRIQTLPILLFATASGGDTSLTAATALFHALPPVLALIVTTRVLARDTRTPFGGRP